MSGQPTAAQAAASRALVLAQLRQGHEVVLVVVGWSMAPLLQPGDRVGVSACAASQVRRGDILVVWQDSSFLTHRLLQPGARAWLMKGDQSLAPDPPIVPQALVGRVVRRERGGVQLNLSTPGWAALSAALGLVGWASAASWPPARRLALRGCRLLNRLLVAAALASQA